MPEPAIIETIAHELAHYVAGKGETGLYEKETGISWRNGDSPPSRAAHELQQHDGAAFQAGPGSGRIAEDPFSGSAAYLRKPDDLPGRECGLYSEPARAFKPDRHPERLYSSDEPDESGSGLKVGGRGFNS